VWQARQLRSAGFADLLRLQWVVLRDPGFFQRLPVHSGLSAARRFWWGTFLLIVVGLLGALKIVHLAVAEDSLWDFALAPIAFFVLPVMFALQAAVMFTGCLWSQFRCGIRDYRISAIACYYASPLIWPLAINLTAVVMSALWLGQVFDQPAVTNAALWTAGAIFAVLTGLALGWLWFWLRRLAAALRAVRYANV
jgi:hypothetical protein